MLTDGPNNRPFDTEIPAPLVRENAFLSAEPERNRVPTFGDSKENIPYISWEGHELAVDCYWKTWELAFSNLRTPSKENGFVSNYIDTAFNDNLFMWDSVFITLFARYADRAFNFQRTLDNLYCKQHRNGFICREIREIDGSDCFSNYDPSGTGPNVMPWSEWEYFLCHGDKERLARVFPTLLAYYRWFRLHRTWPDGTYWATGLSSGMDNQPRIPPEFSPEHFHGHYSWIDTCLQEIFAAGLLIRMADVLERTGEVEDLKREAAALSETINAKFWNESTGFYFDRRPDGTLSDVKTIGAYWALLAGIVPPNRLSVFVSHLSNQKEFNRPHSIPTLSADHPSYQNDGGYWLGGVWAPTNYMVLRGLTRAGEDKLAHIIAMNHLENVVAVYGKTGTLWENYSPEAAAPGKPAKADFVGWTGLVPVAVLLEYVFGLRPDFPSGKLLWDIRLTDQHSVTKYPFGADGFLSLHCQKRAGTHEKPVVKATSNIPVEIEVRWEKGSEIIRAG